MSQSRRYRVRKIRKNGSSETYTVVNHIFEKKINWLGRDLQEFWFLKSILDQVLKPRFKAKSLLPKTVIFYQKPDKSVGSLTGAVSLNLHWKGVISKFRPGRGRPRSLQLWVSLRATELISIIQLRVYFDCSIYYRNNCERRIIMNDVYFSRYY